MAQGPTRFARDPDSLAGSLKADELRLYRLIWQRALASQMADAEIEETQFDVGNGEFGAATAGKLLENMGKAGIIDPVKVVRGALENAASIAAMILTTECLVTDIPEKEKPAPPPMPTSTMPAWPSGERSSMSPARP